MVPGKRPTQTDVARLAGVSQATVSNVLNSAGVIPIPHETRQRVLDAVEELGYVVDAAARWLRTQKSYTIAGVIPDITNPFYPGLERGIQDVAEEQGYDLIVYNTDGIEDKERKCLRSLQERGVDGVVGVFFHLNATDLRILLERSIGVVRIEPMPQEAGSLPLDNVYVDNVAAASAAVSYLLQNGHKRIGMITGDSGPRASRFLGYQQALKSHSIPFNEDLVHVSHFTQAGGEQAMAAILALPTPPTAVFAANDLMAIGAIVAAQKAGRRVPQDIAVMGFDNIPAAQIVSPALSTITIYQENLGRRAAAMLLERLNGDVGEGGRCEEMPFDLVIRESA